VFIFHGNAENFGDGVEFAKIFYLKMRSNVVMVSYRGCVHFVITQSHTIHHFSNIDTEDVLENLLRRVSASIHKWVCTISCDES
jgi:hypothetical protein